jgi:integrase
MGRILLTERFIAGVKTAGEYPDFQVRGLRLRVLPSGLKDWSLRYTSPRDGSRQRLGLGMYPATSLAQARGKALEAKGMLDARQDPRLVLAAAATGAMTVSHLIDSYLEKHVRPNLRSHAEVERRLRKNVEPLIGGMKLGDLHRRDCARVVDAVMARGAPREASHVHADIGALLNWAVGRGDLEHSPAAGLRRPAEPTSRDRVLNDLEIHKLWSALPAVLAPSPGIVNVLRLCLVTGARVGEVAGMERRELNLPAGIWSLPPSRVKNATAFVVPLSDLAISIIREALLAAGNSSFVFPSPSGNGPLTSLQVAQTLARAVVPTAKHPLGRLGIPHFRAHDLRRTCLDYMAKLGIAPMTIGHCANHRSIFKAGVTFSSYVQHTFEPEKRQAFDLWTSRLLAIIDAQPAAEILPLQPRKRG